MLFRSHHELGVEAHGGAGNQGLCVLYACAVERVARGEVVGAIKDDVGVCNKL